MTCENRAEIEALKARCTELENACTIYEGHILSLIASVATLGDILQANRLTNQEELSRRLDVNYKLTCKQFKIDEKE